MDRARQVREVWNYLPAFRVVAETEHLPSAAKALHVSASALSRSIALLEERLEITLFDREGRRIILNSAGRALLAAARDAMRRIDDGISAALSDEPRGPLRLATSSVVRDLVAIPALADVRARYPQLEPHITRLASDPVAGLLQGRIDIALCVDREPTDPSVEICSRFRLRCGVFCGPDHPLVGSSRVPRTRLADFDFAAMPDDGWPVSIPRRVAVHCDDPSSLVTTANEHALLVVLPQQQGWDKRLHLLASDLVGERTVLIARRRPLGPTPAIDWAVRALAARLEAVTSAPD